jgi:hypothetical protein
MKKQLANTAPARLVSIATINPDNGNVSWLRAIRAGQ